MRKLITIIVGLIGLVFVGGCSSAAIDQRYTFQGENTVKEGAVTHEEEHIYIYKTDQKGNDTTTTQRKPRVKVKSIDNGKIVLEVE